jgi:hypothetical protein
MSIAANRHPQIRASLVDNAEDAKVTRQHNDSNVLCLASNHVEPANVPRILDAFLATSFEGGRHERRVEKLEHIAGSTRGTQSLAQADPEIFAAVSEEAKRQFENIELIASENFTSRAVMEAQGSCLTNKYAEGYPGRRWYGGCEHVDVVEQLAINRAKELFGGEHVNVQPHSGSQANMAVYFSVLQPGDRILTMDLAHGGHLTHGNKANFSGRFFEISHYGVSQGDERIDYDALQRQAEEFRPKMITAGASAYPASSISSGCARSLTRSARCSSSTWLILLGLWPQVRTRTQCRSPTLPPRPRTKASGGRAADSSSASAVCKRCRFAGLSRRAGWAARARNSGEGRLLSRSAAAELQGIRSADHQQCQGACRAAYA